jgi:hypothetical protein
MSYRRSLRRVAIAAAIAMGLAAPAILTTTASAAPYCGITWGSLSKTAPTTTMGSMTGVRAGQHPCYDRLVLDFTGHNSGYRVLYVNVVTTDGSGAVVPLRGGAKLQVVALSPYWLNPAHPAEMVNTTGYRTFRQVASAGSFEGQTTIGLGVRARLPFQAFMVQGPGNTSRLVIDVAHQW